MQKLEIDISDVNCLQEAAQKLIEFAGNIKVFTFDAPMGAGKTTLIKQICKTLGSSDNFSSPTYSIVNEYAAPSTKLFHFDLYRVKSPEELLDLGFEEYLDSGNYCFIEWPEIGGRFLPQSYVSIIIDVNQNNRYLRAKILN